MKKPIIIEFTGTPESGKTSCINTLITDLEKTGIQVVYLRETAEFFGEISDTPKDSFKAVHEMREHTLKELEKLKFYSNKDLIIVDRGLVDAHFFGGFYGGLYRDTCSEIEMKNYMELLNEYSFLYPEMLFVFKTTPEEAIRRKGSEGSIVTKKYVGLYNENLDFFCKESNKGENYIIETTKMTKEAVKNKVFGLILNSYYGNLKPRVS